MGDDIIFYDPAFLQSSWAANMEARVAAAAARAAAASALRPRQHAGATTQRKHGGRHAASAQSIHHGSASASSVASSSTSDRRRRHSISSQTATPASCTYLIAPSHSSHQCVVPDWAVPMVGFDSMCACCSPVQLCCMRNCGRVCAYSDCDVSSTASVCAPSTCGSVEGFRPSYEFAACHDATPAASACHPCGSQAAPPAGYTWAGPDFSATQCPARPAHPAHWSRHSIDAPCGRMVEAAYRHVDGRGRSGEFAGRVSNPANRRHSFDFITHVLPCIPDIAPKFMPLQPADAAQAPPASNGRAAAAGQGPVSPGDAPAARGPLLSGPPLSGPPLSGPPLSGPLLSGPPLSVKGTGVFLPGISNRRLACGVGMMG